MAYRRIQVLVEPAQDDELERRAREAGRSKSQLIREALDAAFEPAAWPPLDDPFLSLPPVDGPDDGWSVSDGVDAYLEATEMAKWRQRPS